jgi:WD40 repeat protein
VAFQGTSPPALLGRDIFLPDQDGGIARISFERREFVRYPPSGSPARCLSRLGRERLISGHADGSVRFWNFAEGKLSVLETGSGAITALASDYEQRAYAAGADNRCFRWDPTAEEVRALSAGMGGISLLRRYPGGRILALQAAPADPRRGDPDFDRIRIFDFEASSSQTLILPERETVSGLSVYFDGRIIAGWGRELAVLTPMASGYRCQTLPAHGERIFDTLSMGPRILTCGRDAGRTTTVRIWGTEFFVRRELSRLAIQPPD